MTKCREKPGTTICLTLGPRTLLISHVTCNSTHPKVLNSSFSQVVTPGPKHSIFSVFLETKLGQRNELITFGLVPLSEDYQSINVFTLT